MFKSLAEKFTQIFNSFHGSYKISEKNISDAVREIRLALLDADVNYGIVKSFISRVKEKALGVSTVNKNVSPEQQFIKIIHEELVELLGNDDGDQLRIKDKPTVIMLCGLQGAGKTTFSIKLAEYLKKQQRCRSLLIACDFQRPAAVEQLSILAVKHGFEVFASSSLNPIKAVEEGLLKAEQNKYDVVIIDTAGRLHIDKNLMDELLTIKQVTSPKEILFVANVALGQDAIHSAKIFDEVLQLSGVVFTMMDGDAKAGVALSCKSLLGKPIKFESHGEHINDLYAFNAKSMADRILGMGDTINFVKKAQEQMSKEEQAKLEQKIITASFSYDDYLKQMKMLRKMGSFKKLLGMLPGGFSVTMQQMEETEQELTKIEAIILSMTRKERYGLEDLSMSRIKRIALGSGTAISDVTKLKKNMKQAKEFFKTMNNKKMKEMKNFMGGL